MKLMDKVKDIKTNTKIRVTLKDGTVLTGRYLEFTKAINNDPQIDSIDLQVQQDIYEIYENEIKNIEMV